MQCHVVIDTVSIIIPICGYFSPRAGNLSVSSGTRWSEDEVKRLHEAMAKFNNDLAKISEAVRTRSMYVALQFRMIVLVLSLGVGLEYLSLYLSLMDSFNKSSGRLDLSCLNFFFFFL